MRIFRCELSFELCFTSHYFVSDCHLNFVLRRILSLCRYRHVAHAQQEVHGNLNCSSCLAMFVHRLCLQDTPTRVLLRAGTISEHSCFCSAHRIKMRQQVYFDQHTRYAVVYTPFFGYFFLYLGVMRATYFLFGNAGMVRSIGQRPRRHARCASFTAEVHDNPGTKLRLRRIRMKLMGSTFAMSNLA